ncbi:MAG: CRTAC1 family protein, partial [Thermoanaerobaculia bacterium]
AAFFDYDNDGDLDLFVCNYVRWSKEIDFEVDFRLTGVGRAYGPPFNYEGAFSYLYRNNGDGTFTDVSAESGIQVRNEATGVPVGKALGVLPIDVDLDGWIDILVANDTVQNFLFHNLGDGTFEEAGAYWGIAFGRNGEATGAMGVDAGYYRNDAELGFAIGNFANEMTSLYISQGDPTLFSDEAIGEGVGAPTRTMLSFGVLFFDYDLDGRLDLLQANGHLEGEINTVDPSQTYEQSSLLFWNAGPEQRQGFIPVATESTGDLATPVVGRGSAVADIEGDGDQDVVITQVARAPLLLRNDNELDHHWIRLKLVGDPPNLDALGARVELVAGGITQRRQLMPTRSYLSQSELTITFGLGKNDRVDKLRIYWPDGSEQQLSTIEIDRLTVVEKE